MNSSSMREERASAWLCLVTTAPRTAETTSSSRTPAGSASTGRPRRSASASTSPGTGAGPSRPAEGQGGGAHRVQPLHQGPAVGRVGRGQPCAEDDEDVGAGGGERIRRVVDHHVTDHPAESGRTRRHRGAGQTGQLEGLLDGQAHAFLPARPVVPRGLRGRLGDSPITPERNRAVTVSWSHQRGITLGHDVSPSCRRPGCHTTGSCQESLDDDTHSWRHPP